MESQTRLMTVADVVAHLRISRSAVYRLIADGSLPSCQFGRARRVRLADVNALVETHTTGQAVSAA